LSIKNVEITTLLKKLITNNKKKCQTLRLTFLILFYCELIGYIMNAEIRKPIYWYVLDGGLKLREETGYEKLPLL